MNNRQMMILRDLSETQEYITALVFAKKYKVSTKTILGDIKKLEDFLSPYAILIEKKPRYGIKILEEAKDKKKNRQIIHKLIGNNKFTDYFSRKPYYVKYICLSNRKTDIGEIADALYISESTVNRDLDKLQSELNNYDLKISKHCNEKYILGNEIDIAINLRNFLIDHFCSNAVEWQESELATVLFLKQDILDTVTCIRELCEKYDFFISQQYEIYLITDLLIAKSRYLLQQDSTHLFQLEEIQDTYPNYLFAAELLANILKIETFQINPNQINFISNSILSVTYKKIKEPSKLYEESINAFIEQVSSISKINFSLIDTIQYKLINHIEPMVYRIKNKINIKNGLTKEINKRYNSLYNIVWQASNVLELTFEIEIPESELAFLTLYFVAALKELRRPVSIGVVCPHGIATSELIISSIKDFITEFDFVEKVDLIDIKNGKKYDILISSIILELDTKDYCLVSPLLSNDDISLIQQKYLNLTYGNIEQNRSTVDFNLASSQLSVLLSNSVYFQKNFTTLEECIDFLVTQSHHLNNSSNGFKESIINREKMGSTSLYTGIALPHADPKFVKVSQLQVLTLNKPILWGKNNVSVVALISIKKDEEVLYKEPLLEFYSKIVDSMVVNQITRARKIKEILEII